MTMNSTRILNLFFFAICMTLITSCKTEPIDFSPVAKFSILRIDNETVEFRNNSINATSYLWDFGDGNTSTEKDPTHIYTSIGNYNVVLTAYLDDKSDQTSNVAIVSRIYPENLTELPNPPFGARTEALSFSWNGKGYVAAGTANFQTSQDLWEFNPTDQTWKKLSDTPKGFNRGVSFVINGAAYMGLGQTPWGNGASEFYKYDIATDTYSSVGSMPTSSPNLNNPNWVDAVAFSYQEKGYVIGGSANFQEIAKVMEFNPDDNSWLEKSSYPGEGGSGMFHFVLDGNVYMGMGNRYGFNGFDVLTDMYKYDIANNSWTQLSTFPNDGRRDAKGFVYDGKGYIAFGYRNDIVNGSAIVFPELWEYNVTTDEWMKIESMPISIAHHFYHFIFGNKYYFGGGNDGGNGSLTDFYEYVF